MWFEDVLFFIAAAGALAGALGVVLLQNPFYSVLSLVAHLLTYSRDDTVAAIAARAAEIDVVGADIDAYADKVRIVAEAGIFGPDQLRTVISDRITAWGVADEPALRQFVSENARAGTHVHLGAELQQQFARLLTGHRRFSSQRRLFHRTENIWQNFARGGVYVELFRR